MMVLNNDNKKIMIDIYMKKSEKAFEAAVALSKMDDQYDAAANRAYYSIFQSENALLLTKGILGNSHKHVHNAISKEFVQSGELSSDTFKKIYKVLGIRVTGDYSGTEFVTKEEMEKAIYGAREFLDNAKKLIAEFKLEQEKEKEAEFNTQKD